MAYKLPVNHFQEGANLLQNDGSVYWYDDPGRIAEEIQRVNDHLAELRESGE